MSERQIVSLLPYIDVLHRHRLSFTSVLAAGLGLTACALVILPRAYRSSALLMEEPPEVAPSYVAEPAAIDMRDRINLLSHSVLSRQHLAVIIRSLDLYPRRRAAHQSVDELTYHMRRRITLQPIIGTLRSGQRPNAVELSFEYPVPALAQAVTARLSKIFIETDHARRVAAAAVAQRFLRDQVTAARDALDAKSAEIKAFEDSHAGALPDEMASNLQQLGRLQQQLQFVSETALHAGTTSPRTRLERLKTRLAVMRARYSNVYPDVVTLRAEIDALSKQTAVDGSHPSGVRPDGAGMLGSGQTPAADGLQARRAALLRQVADVRERIAETPANEQQLAALKRDYGVLADNYSRLMRRQLGAQATMLLERRDEGERLSVAEAASLPLHPARPNRLAILALGAILSLVAAIALPFALFFTDSSFRNPEELAQEHSNPVLIAIPELKEMRERRGRLRNGIGAGAG